MLTFDVDAQLIKCITYMYNGNIVRNNNVETLQSIVEEAIVAKCGVPKDLSISIENLLIVANQTNTDDESLFDCMLIHPVTVPTLTTAQVPIVVVPAEIPSINKVTVISTITGNNNQPDNDLELDLFKADLMCVVCYGMDVASGNRLIECSECHSLFHQECHQPPVTLIDSFDGWICESCKIRIRRMMATPAAHPPASIVLPISVPIVSSTSGTSSSLIINQSADQSSSASSSSSSDISISSTPSTDHNNTSPTNFQKTSHDDAETQNGVLSVVCAAQHSTTASYSVATSSSQASNNFNNYNTNSSNLIVSTTNYCNTIDDQFELTDDDFVED